MRRNIMCVGKNYLEHVGEVDSTMPGISKAKVPDWPIIFTKAPSAVAGPGEAVGFPEGLSEQVDYEGEVAVIIGRGGRGIRVHLHILLDNHRRYDEPARWNSARVEVALFAMRVDQRD